MTDYWYVVTSHHMYGGGGPKVERSDPIRSHETADQLAEWCRALITAAHVPDLRHPWQPTTDKRDAYRLNLRGFGPDDTIWTNGGVLPEYVAIIRDTLTILD